MSDEQQTIRDWHRLFGMVLTDFFTDSPFVVEVERDMSAQQQLLDVVIVRRGRGRFSGRLPDGMDKLATHNLITFKSHHETLDAWAMKELVGFSVAYRKFVSPTTSELLPEEEFRLYAVSARFPAKISGLVPLLKCQEGVYDCSWGTDIIRVIVPGELPRESHNAPFHLFSASPGLIGFGQGAYRQRSKYTSKILGQLFKSLQAEGLSMYTMKDFERDLFIKYFPNLTPQEQEEVLSVCSPEARLAGLPPEARLAGLPPETRLAGLSEEQIREYLDQLTVGRKTTTRKPRRKKK